MANMRSSHNLRREKRPNLLPVPRCFPKRFMGVPLAKASDEKRLRILCLHDYRSNGSELSKALKSFRKCVEKHADFCYVTSFLQAAPLMQNHDTLTEERAWWANKYDGNFQPTHKDGPALGFQESLRFIEETWHNRGPFHGLLGYGQGACMAGIICGLAQENRTTVQPAFAVLIAGFVSSSRVHKGMLKQPILIPSLHMYDSEKANVPHEMSLELAGYYQNAELLDHAKVDAPQLLEAYEFFIRDRLQDKMGKSKETGISEKSKKTEQSSCGDGSEKGEEEQESGIEAAKKA